MNPSPLRIDRAVSQPRLVRRPPRGWGLAVGVMLVVACGWVGGAAADGLRDLASYTSRFYVIHTNLSKREAVEYGRHMDLVFASYSKLFKSLRGKRQKPQNLYLLRTQADYLQTLRDLGIDGTGSGGMFFWGGGTGLATWVENRPRGRTLSVLQHEGFHQFARARLGDELPIWVNEGLAEYFEHAIVVNGKLRAGIVDGGRLEAVREAVKANRAIPFDALLNISHAEWNQNVRTGNARAALQYAQSWMIVHFLVHGDGGRYGAPFSAYLIELSGGRDHTVAFRNAFGTLDTQPFANRWLKFLGQARPDNFSEATHRVQFLAAGMTKTQGAQGWPQTLDELKARMIEQKFELKYVGDAGPTTLSAKDPTWYGYTDDQGQSQPFTFQVTPEPKRSGRGRRGGTPAADDPDKGLPPTLVAAGLSPPVYLTWAYDDDGRLQPQVAYVAPRPR